MPQLSLHSPIGDMTIAEEDGELVSVDWGWVQNQTETPLLCRARAQIQEYFDGARRGFDLPLTPAGSPYQLRVWQALAAIPYNQTRNYAQIAVAAGGSPRSVGQANGRNPLPLLIPCHRVVGSHGLGGYSGGDGIETKLWLLAHESRVAAGRAA
jgi:methylated-DNA-[protein]-cysteine S-methyltransferase